MSLHSPYDGTRTTWFFGPDGRTPWKVDALTLASAVRQFRVGALFPEMYADPTDGQVPICVSVANPTGGGRTWTEVVRVPPRVPDDPDLVRMLSLAGDTGMPSTQTALGPATPAGVLQASSRTRLEEETLSIRSKMAEIEQMKQELERQASAIRLELTRRLEQLWIFELFLGAEEQVTVLRTGAPASVDTPVAVRQRVLCMDEEYATVQWLKNPSLIGTFSYRDLPTFDAWLAQTPDAVAQICPWPKGIVALRVRRRPRDLGPAKDLRQAMENAQEHFNDEMTYLLVRNGEQLYRLWVDVTLWPRMFANRTDAERAHPVNDDIFTRHRSEDAQKAMKRQMAGLVAVQGILERSTLLAPLPEGINVFSPGNPHHFLLVRDDEPDLGLEDGSDPVAKIRWSTLYVQGPDGRTLYPKDGPPIVARLGYKDWLTQQVKPGVRMLWTGKVDLFSSRDRDDPNSLAQRIGRWTPRGDRSTYGVSVGPKPDVVYTLQDIDPTYYFRLGFLYLPDQPRDHYDKDGNRSEVSRRKRVLFRVSPEECFPVDYASWRVLEHLIQDRTQREDYGEFFRTAFCFWSFLKAQAEAERPFVDLVLKMEGAYVDDESERARCERLLRWWKLKTKEHRTIASDDAKALRMIRAAFRRGDDEHRDPETQLFASGACR